MAVADAWLAVSSIKRWTPISKIDLPLILLRDGLFSAGGGCYLLTSPDNRLRSDPSGPFATLAFWAPSDGAALRAALADIAADDGASGIMPPDGMRNLKYKAIVDQMKEDGESPSEHATYAGRPAALFVHKVIASPTRTYYFRDQRIRPSEVPYAISRRLSE